MNISALDLLLNECSINSVCVYVYSLFQFSISNIDMDISTIVNLESKKAVITHIPSITRSFMDKPKGDKPAVIRTDGVNISEIHKLDEALDTLDINKLYTNDPHAMARHYGIEAAERIVIQVSTLSHRYGLVKSHS